jgi:lipid-A-disaccharide synthase-like uncharacterized protein
MLRRTVRGLDEMALEVAFIAVAAMLGAVALFYAVNSGPAYRLDPVPVLGTAVGGFRTLVGFFVHPSA